MQYVEYFFDKPIAITIECILWNIMNEKLPSATAQKKRNRKVIKYAKLIFHIFDETFLFIKKKYSSSYSVSLIIQTYNTAYSSIINNAIQDMFLK